MALSDLHAMLATVKHHHNARRLNEIANHPAVLPWLGGEEGKNLDLTAAAADPDNVVLVGAHGAVLFHQIQRGIFDAHSMALPEGRGAWMASFARACLHFIFTRTMAVEVMMQCPKGNLAVRALTKLTGARYEFTNKAGRLFRGRMVPVDVFGLRLQDWIPSAPGLEERGHWFHQRLEAEFARHGRAEPQHPDDDAHDRYVGLACEMAFGGQPEKAVAFYRRWASLAGYAPIELASRLPVAFDIQNAMIVLTDDDFYVASLYDGAQVH